MLLFCESITVVRVVNKYAVIELIISGNMLNL